eukprot:s406_g12.t1
MLQQTLSCLAALRRGRSEGDRALAQQLQPLAVETHLSAARKWNRAKTLNQARALVPAKKRASCEAICSYSSCERSLYKAQQKTSADLGAINGLNPELVSLLRGEEPKKKEEDSSDDESSPAAAQVPQTLKGYVNVCRTARHAFHRLRWRSKDERSAVTSSRRAGEPAEQRSNRTEGT